MVEVSPSDPVPPSALGRVHLIGVGGVGMSAIARIMLARGIPVSGSDVRESSELDALRALGASIVVGHHPTHVEHADTVVYTSAVRGDNPELAAATQRGLRVLPRAAALAALMVGRTAVTVAGTHGKTTTAAMLATILREGGEDPTFAIGGELKQLGTNGHDGAGRTFVAEADESDESFLYYRPDLAVITNIDSLADHLDYFRTTTSYQDAFGRFIERVPGGGTVVVCADDELAMLAAERAASDVRVQSYGVGVDAHLHIGDMVHTETGSGYVVTFRGQLLGRVELRAVGRHNVLNSAAALLAALLLGVSDGDARSALARFEGTRRRMESKGSVNGVRVFDTYAHHPREIAADLDAARIIAGSGRVLVLFQPHLYSRTRIFASEFADSLSGADGVVVLDVYAAREPPDPDVTGELIASAVALPADRVRFVPRRSEAVAQLTERARPDDVILTAGAGDVTALASTLLDALAAAQAKAT